MGCFEIDENNLLSGFIRVDNNLVRKIIQECGLDRAMIYYIILSHKNKDKDSCYPSFAEISRECCISVSTVKRNINVLVDRGYLIVKSGDTSKANNYYFPHEKGMYSKAELAEIKNIKRRKIKDN